MKNGVTDRSDFPGKCEKYGLGVLLGCGKGNAQLFYERKHSLLQPIFSHELNQLFRNVKATLNFSIGWPNPEISEILMYPNFMADATTDETKSLKSDYLQTRKKILSYYENKNFLEATLQLLEQ